MIEYTHQNSLKFGFGGEWLNARPDMETPIVYSMERCTRKPGNLQEEFHVVARMYAEKAKAQGRHPFIMLSGGMDSEVVCKAFIEQDLDFTPITFRFDNDLNGHETTNASKFCQRHGLDHVFYDIAVERFLESSEAEHLFLNSYCSAAILIPHMKTMSYVWENLNGMPILGGGDIVIHNMQRSGKWHYCKLEYMLPWYWHMRNNEIDGGVAFFQHTPETTAAMLNEPRIENIAMGRDTIANKTRDDTRATKYLVYQDYWPDLQTRSKFAGHERAASQFIAAKARFRSKQELTYDEIWSMPYAEFRSSIEPM